MEIRLELVLVFISLYLPYEYPDPPEQVTGLGSKGNLIAGCGDNAHHVQWGNRDTNARVHF